MNGQESVLDFLNGLSAEDAILMRDILCKMHKREEKEGRSKVCPHVPPCFEKMDGCWNYDEAKKRVDAYPNFP